MGSCWMFLSQLVKGSGLCSTVPKSHGVVSCKGVHPQRPSPAVLHQAGYAHTAEHGGGLQLSPEEPTHKRCQVGAADREPERCLALSWTLLRCGSSGWRPASSVQSPVTSPTNGSPESQPQVPDRLDWYIYNPRNDQEATLSLLNQ